MFLTFKDVTERLFMHLAFPKLKIDHRDLYWQRNDTPEIQAHWGASIYQYH